MYIICTKDFWGKMEVHCICSNEEKAQDMIEKKSENANYVECWYEYKYIAG